MKYFSILITIISTTLLFSCQKKDVDGYQSDKLSIAISKPNESQIFRKGDTVFVSGTATYVSQLHGYSIQISNKATKEVYLDIDEHLHDASFTINTYWVDTLSQAADLNLELTVEVDHDGNEQSKEINFQSKPE